ncbi:MAG TPA: alpha/beta hydrolase [Candidatus Nitrosocosmicus sp.]
MKKYNQKKVLGLICLAFTLIVISVLVTYPGVANAQGKTLNQNSETNKTVNTVNIILVHGLWADGSSWGKVIPILQKEGHRVIAVQLPLHSLIDDVSTVKRAINFIGGPVILVGHSYGGMVISNAAYNNPDVKGLVYIAALAPKEGQTVSNILPPFPEKFEGKPLLMKDNGGFAYLNPSLFHDLFAQDVDSSQTNTMAVVQKPANLSGIVNEKSGPPAWKQLPTWYQISENDRAMPPTLEHQFAKQINATTISILSSHASLVSHPHEIAQLILDAAKRVMK